MMRSSLVGLLLLAAAVAAEPLAGNWSLDPGRDPDTWKDIEILSLDSINEIADEYATQKVHPQLAFECVPGGDATIRVRLDWRRFISSFNTEVSFKADDRELLLVNWGVDKSNKITLPRSSGDGQDLINYLKGASGLQVEVIPYSSSLITVQYDLSGFDAALQALASRCS
jgi:hypothetical protein